MQYCRESSNSANTCFDRTTLIMKFTLAAAILAGLLPFSASAQAGLSSSEKAASCEELGTLAPYVERCGGTPPKSRSITETSNDVAEWTKAYLQCAKSSVKDLDDRTSDASVIAIGISALCRNVNPPLSKIMSLSEGDSMIERMKPYTITIVLQYRTAAAKRK